MKVTRRRFVEAVVAIAGFWRAKASATVLSVADGRSPEGFVQVAELRDICPPSSAPWTQEQIRGLALGMAENECSFDINWPGDA